MANRSAEPMAVVKGTLDALVLKALAGAPMHGLEISEWLEDRSSGALEVEDAAVYQAVYRLEEKGLISAEWGVTENNRKARYYRVTSQGRSHLKGETERWVRYAETVTGILTAPQTA